MNATRRIPSARVAALLRRELGDPPGVSDPCIASAYTRLAEASGVGTRRIHSIVTEEFANVTFQVVDKILTGLDRVDLWHLPEELGGLADYYESDEPPPPADLTPEQLERGRAHRARRRQRQAVTV